MDVVISLLIWLHFLALVAGGSAAVGMPIVGSRMATASAETRPILFGIMKTIGTVSRAGLGTLIVTGPLIAWLKYGGFGDLNVWFWIKMALVLVLFAGVIYSGVNMRRAAAGDAEAGRRGRLLGPINAVVLVAIVLAAVLAFD